MKRTPEKTIIARGVELEGKSLLTVQFLHYDVIHKFYIFRYLKAVTILD